jgi:hypothetical protein
MVGTADDGSPRRQHRRRINRRDEREGTAAVRLNDSAVAATSGHPCIFEQVRGTRELRDFLYRELCGGPSDQA